MKVRLDCFILSCVFGFQLENQKAKNEAVCVSYRDRIGELWERLQISQEERDLLAEHMMNNKKINMEAVSINLRPSHSK